MCKIKRKQDLPFILNKICIKCCPEALFVFNLNCPEETHKIEGKNMSECNNLFYIDEINNIKYLKKIVMKQKIIYVYKIVL